MNSEKVEDIFSDIGLETHDNDTQPFALADLLTLDMLIGYFMDIA